MLGEVEVTGKQQAMADITVQLYSISFLYILDSPSLVYRSSDLCHFQFDVHVPAKLLYLSLKCDSLLL